MGCDRKTFTLVIALMTLATLVAHHLERQVSWGPGSEALSVREIFNTGQSYYQKSWDLGIFCQSMSLVILK